MFLCNYRYWFVKSDYCGRGMTYNQFCPQSALAGAVWVSPGLHLPSTAHWCPARPHRSLVLRARPANICLSCMRAALWHGIYRYNMWSGHAESGEVEAMREKDRWQLRETGHQIQGMSFSVLSRVIQFKAGQKWAFFKISRATGN